jgi:type I restriction enzyme R subunit
MGKTTALVRRLRSELTPAERSLWRLLRDRGLSRLKFRRQFPIGPFVADFCCYELRLVVELDGAVHHDEQGIARDGHRDAYIRGLGYTILRFDNALVLHSPETVFESILATAGSKTWVTR